MARLIQGVVVKHNLMKQPLVVVNKSGGAGAEGFLDVKNAKGEPHKIIVTLSNLFTTPMATGVPFSWKDMTPVAMLALDNFVLWVNAETPYKSAQEYLTAAKQASTGASKFKMGGTGSKQEDQILTVGLEKAAGAKFIYVPFKGGGAVAVQLVGKHTESNVNNPSENVAQWRAGQVRALAVTSRERTPIAPDLPTFAESGFGPGFDVNGWFALLGPRAMPRPVVEALNRDINKALQMPETREQFKSWGIDVTPGAPAELANLMSTELARWREVVRVAKVKVG
jgi:tripartite-type tricarboxylate transporter receptor subunit TctC